MLVSQSGSRHTSMWPAAEQAAAAAAPPPERLLPHWRVAGPPLAPHMLHRVSEPGSADSLPPSLVLPWWAATLAPGAAVAVSLLPRGAASEDVAVAAAAPAPPSQLGLMSSSYENPGGRPRSRVEATGLDMPTRSR